MQLPGVKTVSSWKVTGKAAVHRQEGRDGTSAIVDAPDTFLPPVTEMLFSLCLCKE